MNNPNQQIPINVKQILDVIEQTGNIGIGRNKRRKLEKELRAKLMESGGVPTTSAMNVVKTELEDDIDLPEFIGLGTTYPPVRLHPTDSVDYDSKHYMGYDEVLLNNSSFFHMVMVIDNRKHEKRHILDSLFNIVGDELFVPFVYRPRRSVDYFLVHNQSKAMRKIFDSCLKVKIRGADCHMVVKLGVARFEEGHPKVVDRVFACIEERMNSAALHGGADVLDLTQLSQHQELNNFELRLSNKSTLNLLADQLNGVERIKKDFHVLKLANNEIKTLESFTKLYGFKLNVLDLRHNNIKLIEEFHFLKHLEIHELYLSGNACTQIESYRDKIFDIITSLKTIDGMQKLQTGSSITATLEMLKKTKRGNSARNNPILKINDGIFIKKEARKKEEFTHLQNNFGSYRDEVQSFWTQVQILHNNLPFEEIFDVLMAKMFKYSPFFPCYYKRLGSKDEFFVYKNFNAIRSIMQNNLECPMPQGQTVTFSLRLKAAPYEDGQVDWFYKIRYVLSKRNNDSNSTTLDLNNFVNDPEFSHMLVMLNNKSNLASVLEAARSQNNNYVKISAQNNGLTTLEGFQSLHQDSSGFSKVTTLDLRNNKLLTLDGITLTSNIKELLLDGNPICERFSTPNEYISEVLKHFTQLDHLDGHKIDPTLKMVTMQNFLVVRDAYVFVDEFVKTFFAIYDSEDRRRIMDAYDTSAMLTISCYFDPSAYLAGNVIKDLHTRIQRYATVSRSINKVANMNLIYNSVFTGLGSIENIFNKLPKTQHIFTTFCIDCPVYDPKHRVVITVSGTFEDFGQQLNETMLLIAFTRTFVLKPAGENIFKITNEQLSIHCPTIIQREVSTSGRATTARDDFIRKNCRDLMPTEIEEKELKLILFKELTQQKTEVCLKFLEENFWDVKVSLVVFNTLMDSGNVPNENFEFK